MTEESAKVKQNSRENLETTNLSFKSLLLFGQWYQTKTMGERKFSIYGYGKFRSIHITK